MKILKISILVLAFFAVVLGYAAYSRNSGSPEAISPVETSEVSPSSELSPEERRVLTSPPRGATLAEQQDFAAFIRERAEEAPYLELSGTCTSKPVALSIKEGLPLKVKNTTSAEQVLVFSDTDMLRVPAASTQEFDISFVRGGNIYAYGCVYAGGLTGRLVVTK